MKPRVMSLAIFTCVVGFLIAPFKNVDYLNAIFQVRFLDYFVLGIINDL